MKDFFIFIRNKISRFFYRLIFKRIFFIIDPETIHQRIVRTGEFWGSTWTFLFSYNNKRLEQDILGIRFANPVGLAAGFDKNGQLIDFIPSLGFGFTEIGSITGQVCSGNTKPRLWRLKKSKGIIVNYGLPNDGSEKIAQRLKHRDFSIPLGISIAKTNSQQTVEINKGIDDYLRAYNQLKEIGSYLVVNISCPNTFGGEPFTEPERLDKLLGEMDKIPTQKPVFLKISPDLTKQEIDQIITISKKHRLSGFVCANAAKNRSKLKIIEKKIPEKGGITGRPIQLLTNNLISYLYRQTRGEFIIIGCGGVFSAEDAYQKIKLGACLVQLMTGMIFEGPQLISEINQGLIRLLEQDGLTNISQAVGLDNQG